MKPSNSQNTQCVTPATTLFTRIRFRKTHLGKQKDFFPSNLSFTLVAFSSLMNRRDRDPTRSGFIDQEQFARLRSPDRCHHSDCDDWSVFNPDLGCRS
jgi:hypothetical protein